MIELIASLLVVAAILFVSATEVYTLLRLQRLDDEVNRAIQSMNEEIAQLDSMNKFLHEIVASTEKKFEDKIKVLDTLAESQAKLIERSNQIELVIKANSPSARSVFNQK
jgi:vacuolar-type H+-ATPase subunit I/STV1